MPIPSVIKTSAPITKPGIAAKIPNPLRRRRTAVIRSATPKIERIIRLFSLLFGLLIAIVMVKLAESY